MNQFTCQCLVSVFSTWTLLIPNGWAACMDQHDVCIRVETTNLDGEPITSLTLGEEFVVQTFVHDVRAASPIPDTYGVFTAYVDMIYPAELVSSTSPLEYPGFFLNGIYDDADVRMTPGILDEAGSFSNSVIPLGRDEQILFTARFRATASGLASFSLQTPPHRTPANDVLVYGSNEIVPDERVGFVGTSVQVVPEPSTGFLALAVLPLLVLTRGSRF